MLLPEGYPVENVKNPFLACHERKEVSVEDLKGVSPYQNSAAIEENRLRDLEGGLGWSDQRLFKNNGKPIPQAILPTYRYRPTRHLQHVAETFVVLTVSILLDRLQTCDLSSQTLGNFLWVCAILALTSGSAVNIFFIALIWKLPTWLILTRFFLPWHATLQRWPTCVRSYPVSLQPEPLADQAIAENPSHSFSEDWEWIGCTRMILNDDFDQILEFFHQFASNSWRARRRGEVHEQAKDLWSLTVGHAVGHKLTSQWATTSSCIY